MLSYQHGYHAGNFADVVKHLALTRILNYLTKKDKPFFYLETHAGRGRYDLKDGQATKTLEHQDGISLLWEQRKKLSAVFNPYLDAIKELNQPNTLRFYPGSPSLAISALREQDRLACSELHPREFNHLEELPTHGKRVHYRHSDGLSDLQALLPPPERRGLVFVDPSYEIKDEYKLIPQHIKAAFNRFSTGVYCIWYPIIDRRLHSRIIRGFKEIDAKETLQIEFSLTSSIKDGMTGCGLWIINPPFVLAEEMKEILTVLRTIFNPGVSSFIIEK